MSCKQYLSVLLGSIIFGSVSSQPTSYNSSKPAGSSNPSSNQVAATCGPSTANIVCIERYGSLLPPSFFRDPDPTVGYSGTAVPDDASWDLVAKADFVVFDRQRGLEILGPAPKLHPKVFDVPSVVHEAPIYVPHLNKLFVTQDGPPGNLSNLVIDLNVDPPTLETFVTDPPVYQPTGGILHDNMIYWAVQGNNQTLPGGEKQRPGVVRVDPATLKAEWLVNNYYGFSFGGLNDLTVDAFGDVWFTDSEYGYALDLSPAPNQIQLATYRFRPSTGAISVVEDTLSLPNGIAFSRDGRTLYIADSGLEIVTPTASRGKNDFYAYSIKIGFVGTNKRNVYAFDVVRPQNNGGSGALAPYLTNKRSVFQSLEGIPDGLKVARNGMLVVGTGLSTGVDIIAEDGTPVARIQTTHAVENIAWSGEDLKTLWLVGIGGISRVDFNLQGPDPNNYFL